MQNTIQQLRTPGKRDRQEGINLQRHATFARCGRYFYTQCTQCRARDGNSKKGAST